MFILEFKSIQFSPIWCYLCNCPVESCEAAMFVGTKPNPLAAKDPIHQTKIDSIKILNNFHHNTTEFAYCFGKIFVNRFEPL